MVLRRETNVPLDVGGVIVIKRPFEKDAVSVKSEAKVHVAIWQEKVLTNSYSTCQNDSKTLVDGDVERLADGVDGETGAKRERNDGTEDGLDVLLGCDDGNLLG